MNAFEKIKHQFPDVDKIMLGRGAINNPSLVHCIRTGECNLTKEKLRAFHDRLLEDYKPWMSGEKNLLFRMKELWSYWSVIFPEGNKSLKKIRKSMRLADYYPAVNEMFETPMCVDVEDGSTRLH